MYDQPPVRFLIVLLSLAATPVFAQSSTSDAAFGLAGIFGMLGLFGVILGMIYSVLLFFLPFMVLGCLNKLTSIRDDIRGLRKDLAAMRGDAPAAEPSLRQTTKSTSIAPPPSFKRLKIQSDPASGQV